MERLKELNDKARVSEDIGPAITVQTDTIQEVITTGRSHDAEEVSHNGSSQGTRSHDPLGSSCVAEENDVKPVDEEAVTQGSKMDLETQDERKEDDTETTQEKTKTLADQQNTSSGGGGQEKSSPAPFAAVPSTSIGSGLYVVALHRKMVSAGATKLHFI